MKLMKNRDRVPKLCQKFVGDFNPKNETISSQAVMEIRGRQTIFGSLS